MRVSFIGHKGSTLWGYDIAHPSYEKLRKRLREFFINEHVTEVYVGMELGFDTVVALAVIDCKEMGHDIKLIACITCYDQDNRWSYEDRMRYRDIIFKTDNIYGVQSDGSEVQLVHMYIDEHSYCFMDLDVNPYTVVYKPGLTKATNRILVNHCDTLVALWNGKRSSVSCCIDYAKRLGKVNVVIWNPEDFE